MFTAEIMLKFKYPHAKRTYTVLLGKFAMIAMGIKASIACAICDVIGFYPPEEIYLKNKLTYILLMIVGNIVVILPPFIIASFRKPN
jgi:hypothetical protein